MKAENILFDENYYPKISDFGFSILKKEKSNSSIYNAPKFREDNNRFYSKYDVYSFAILTFDIITEKK